MTTPLKPMPDNIQTPYPGTDAALRLGCTCPVIDNHYGKGVPTMDGPQFWYTEGCPVHAPTVKGPNQ